MASIYNIPVWANSSIEYKKNDIMEKINSFFGYNLINKINLKIVQKNDLSNKKIFPEIKNLSEIENKMNEINNKQLKESLNYFLKVYNDRNKQEKYMKSVLMVMAHPDDEIIFGYPIFQDMNQLERLP